MPSLLLAALYSITFLLFLNIDDWKINEHLNVINNEISIPEYIYGVKENQNPESSNNPSDEGDQVEREGENEETADDTELANEEGNNDESESCPEGTLRDADTGECEVELIPLEPNFPEEECPEGTLRDADTGECEVELRPLGPNFNTWPPQDDKTPPDGTTPPPDGTTPPPDGTTPPPDGTTPLPPHSPTDFLDETVPLSSPTVEVCMRENSVHNETIGMVTIRKISMDKNSQLMPDSAFTITPNPYALNNTLLVIDNDENDCDPTDGNISLDNVTFGAYDITELDWSNNKNDRTREFTVFISDKLTHMVINIIERNDLGRPLTDNKIPLQYIVKISDETGEDPETIANEYSAEGIGSIIQVYEGPFRGFAITISNPNLLYGIMSDPRVLSVRQDENGRIASLQENQTIPTGLKRVDAYPESNGERIGTGGIEFDVNDYNNRYDNPHEKENISNHTPNNFTANTINYADDVDVDIAILDTGISKSHPDLYVYKDISFINGSSSGEDDQGHGSLVAGIAAAKDNGLGTVGIAPGARLWAIKICDHLGNCPISSQIKGIEYVTAHANEIDVVNISVENTMSEELEEAINKAVEAGVTVVVAAGNSGIDASLTSPARNPSVIAVSAIVDSDGKCGGIGSKTPRGLDDTFGNFSNFGSAIDIAAPGVDIFSTYKAEEYGINSGTSVAAPHVTGLAALYKATHNQASPEDIHKALIDSGSIFTVACNGRGYGYFTGDTDGYNEPLLHASSLE